MADNDRHSATHIPDRDLLLAADRELPESRLRQVRAHLSACGDCKARMDRILHTSADFSSAYRRQTDDALPESGQARANLQKKLSASMGPSRRAAWHEDLHAAWAGSRWGYKTAIAAVAIFSLVLVYRQYWLTGGGAGIAQVQAAPLPRPNLTPGAARDIPLDACLASAKYYDDDSAAVPVSERKAVFREYGMDYRRAGHYELDYLITPALGGTNDIHNLWPEPYDSTEWNAHVKDQLEDYLHQMVCGGQIDLSTAQHDIATNWIEAYKRYFHTDKPLPSYPAALRAAREAVAKS